MYDVTVRTRKGECVFGEVSNGQVTLSAGWEIARVCWEGIPEHFENVRLDEYVVMPNHVHGIVIIEKSLVRTRHAKETAGKHADEKKIFGRGFIHETRPGKGLINQTPTSTNTYAWPLMKDPRIILGKIVRAYKARCSKLIHDAGHSDFCWQRSFYEHIIRDGEDLDRTREYILENPQNWKTDEDFPGNLGMDPLHRGRPEFSALD